MLIIRLIFTLLTVCFLAACGTPLPMESDHHNRFSYNNEEVEEALTGKQQFDKGIALSGGGIRSSAFSIGVLKGLYDKNQLQDVDVFSSVSGGSYAAYWLMSSEYENPDSRRFLNVLGGKAFKEEACTFNLLGNFITIPQMLLQLAGGPQNYDKFYRCKIERTYGHNEIINSTGKHLGKEPIQNCKNEKSKSKPIHFYRTKVESKQLPYFIMNGTLQNPFPNKGISGGTYELTPFIHGNTSYKYHPWGNQSLPLSQVTAISGAAIRPLLDVKITNPNPNIIQEKITLSDGGHSENLGLLALIRRGTKEIISVDAEYDPDYIFEGYYRLKDRLANWGVILANTELDSRPRKKMCNDIWEEIDRPNTSKKRCPEWWERENSGKPKNGIYTAKAFNAETGDLISNIQFIKLVVDDNILNDLKETKDELLKHNGKTELTRVLDELEANKDADGDMICKGNLDDFNIKLIFDQEIVRAPWFDGDFPQKTTADQSYFQNEMAAYMGLGYKYGSKLSF